MKTIVKLALTAGVIANVLSYAADNYYRYKGAHWRESIVAEVQSHYPGQNIVVERDYYDTGDIAAVILVLRS